MFGKCLDDDWGQIHKPNGKGQRIHPFPEEWTLTIHVRLHHILYRTHNVKRFDATRKRLRYGHSPGTPVADLLVNNPHFRGKTHRKRHCTQRHTV